jgi:hypothetical protein
MNEYVLRLIRCGYSPHDAYSTYVNFIKEYGLTDFLLFLESLEEDLNYVHQI